MNKFLHCGLRPRISPGASALKVVGWRSGPNIDWLWVAHRLVQFHRHARPRDSATRHWKEVKRVGGLQASGPNQNRGTSNRPETTVGSYCSKVQFTYPSKKQKIKRDSKSGTHKQAWGGLGMCACATGSCTHKAVRDAWE